MIYFKMGFFKFFTNSSYYKSANLEFDNKSSNSFNENKPNISDFHGRRPWKSKVNDKELNSFLK